MSERELLPEVIFAKYKNNYWQELQLGEIADFINGRAYKQKELLSKGKYKVLRVGNFYTNSSWYYSNLELGEKYYANDGDLLYTWSATFGPHIYHGEKVIYHYHIWKVELSNKFNKEFAVQLLEYDKDKITGDKNGSAMFHVTKKGMLEKKVVIPTVDEQIIIGDFFKTIDGIIFLQQQLLDNHKQLKKAMLQKIFPQKGESVPRIRFAGFNVDWAVRTLGEISNMYQPTTIGQSDLLDSGIPVFGANGYIGYYSAENHKNDQVTISARGEKAGNPSYVRGPVWITGNSMVINVDENAEMDKYFLYQNLLSLSLKRFVTGGAQPQLTRNVLVRVPIKTPSLKEQEKIGNFFKQLDEIINFHQQKLDTYKKLKKVMLQKMFV